MGDRGGPSGGGGEFITRVLPLSLGVNETGVLSALLNETGVAMAVVFCGVGVPNGLSHVIDPGDGPRRGVDRGDQVWTPVR